MRRRNLRFPRWEWWFDKWIVIVSIILGISVPIIVNSLLELRYSFVFIGCIALIIILLMILIPAPAVWIWKVLEVLYQRVFDYPQLYEFTDTTTRRLNEANKKVSTLITAFLATSPPWFEIQKAWHEDGITYLCLRKKTGVELNLEDKLIIVDFEDLAVLGSCKVAYIRASGYYVTAELDALWKGYLIKQGGEVSVAPKKIAIKVRGNGCE
jgi:hypothetical protein